MLLDLLVAAGQPDAYGFLDVFLLFLFVAVLLLGMLFLHSTITHTPIIMDDSEEQDPIEISKS